MKKQLNELYNTVLWRDNRQCTNCGSQKNVAVYLDDPTQLPTLNNLKTLCIPCLCTKRKIKMKIHNPPPKLIQELRINGITDSKIAKEFLGCSRQRLYQVMEDYTKAKRRLGIS